MQLSEEGAQVGFAEWGWDFQGTKEYAVQHDSVATFTT
jgi:hypothetical protein